MLALGRAVDFKIQSFFKSESNDSIFFLIFESESFDSNIWFCSILKIDYDDLDSQKIK